MSTVRGKQKRSSPARGADKSPSSMPLHELSKHSWLLMLRGPFAVHRATIARGLAVYRGKPSVLMIPRQLAAQSIAQSR